MASSVSQVQAETPPSRPTSQVSAVQERKDESLASPAVSAAVQNHTVPTNSISNTEPFTPPVSRPTPAYTQLIPYSYLGYQYPA